jgi:two-component system response regulator
VKSERQIKRKEKGMNSLMENSRQAIAEEITTQTWAREGGPVVIVDDDANDALWAEEIVDELRPRHPALILTSGEDLMACLDGKDLYSDRSRYPYPGLILLDLQMPKMDGFEVLQWLKGHPVHGEVPTVVLSGCFDMARQVTRAHQLGAVSFLPKPIHQSDLQGVLALLKISI